MPAGTSHGSTASRKSNTRDASTQPTAMAPADASAPGFLLTMFGYFVAINVFVAFFNLLPIPPFDGSHILEGVLPRSWAQAYGKLRGVGMALFFVLVALSWYGPTSGILGHVIGPPVEWMLARFDTLVAWVSGSAAVPL